MTFWSVTIQIPLPNRPVCLSCVLRIAGTPLTRYGRNSSLNWKCSACAYEAMRVVTSATKRACRCVICSVLKTIASLAPVRREEGRGEASDTRLLATFDCSSTLPLSPALSPCAGERDGCTSSSFVAFRPQPRHDLFEGDGRLFQVLVAVRLVDGDDHARLEDLLGH